MPGLYEIRTAISHPLLAVMHLHGFFRNMVFGGTKGVAVVEEDWDNLIILDACRYDLFKACNNLQGDLSAVTSLGSSTGEFMRKNFADREFPDIVYISANPNPVEVDASFYRVIPLYQTAWDKELHTVPPEPVVDEALQAQEEHSHKRLIIHFLQPHYPWIGPKGEQFHEEHGRGDLRENNVWLQLREGELTADQLWSVYRENLEVVLPHIRELIHGLEGKTVITSDHGNCFGEYGVYGHPDRVYPKPLVTVPWLEIDDETRKRVVSGEETESFTIENEDRIHDLLRDLGYVGE